MPAVPMRLSSPHYLVLVWPRRPSFSPAYPGEPAALSPTNKGHRARSRCAALSVFSSHSLFTCFSPLVFCVIYDAVQHRCSSLILGPWLFNPASACWPQHPKPLIFILHPWWCVPLAYCLAPNGLPSNGAVPTDHHLSTHLSHSPLSTTPSTGSAPELRGAPPSHSTAPPAAPILRAGELAQPGGAPTRDFGSLPSNVDPVPQTLDDLRTILGPPRLEQPPAPLAFYPACPCRLH